MEPFRKKLDWTFGNTALHTKWPTTNSTFLPRSVSDHSASVTAMGTASYRPKPPFKFLNFWAEKEEFMEIVSSLWKEKIEGNPFIQLTTKMWLVRDKLRNLHQHNSSHITRRVCKAKADWDKVQIDLDTNPTNAGLQEQERVCARQYVQLSNDEESFYRQKSRIQWLKLGDRSTKFFHRSLVHRRGRNTVQKLNDGRGSTITDPRLMGKVGTDYY